MPRAPQPAAYPVRPPTRQDSLDPRMPARPPAPGAAPTRGSLTPFHSLTSSVNVDFRPARPGRPADAKPVPKAATSALARRRAWSVKRRWLAPPPSGAGRKTWRPGRAIGSHRVAAPKRRQREQLLGELHAELLALDDGVNALQRRRVARLAEHLLGVCGRTPARTPPGARARSPGPPRRDGRRSGAGDRRRRSAPRAGRTRRCCSPEPLPVSPRRARFNTIGRWWRSARREATIPITPALPVLAREHVGRARVGGIQGRDLRFGLVAGYAAPPVGARGWRGRARRPPAPRAVRILGQDQLQARVGAIQAARRR